MRLTNQRPGPTSRSVFRGLLFLALYSGLTSTLFGQAKPPDEEEQTNFGPVYVRRFSAGLKLRYLPLETIRDGTLTTSVTDTVYVDVVNDPRSSHFSYGLTAQAAVTNKWAVAVEALTHKIEYQEVRDVTTVILDPFEETVIETQLVTEDETTSARVWDIPILGRYYTKSRYTRGPRVFFEGGLVVRRLTAIKTSIETTFSTTDPAVEDMTDCCDTTPIKPANPNALGGVLGVGVQVIDDVGVRVIPGFRYTRWFSNALDNPPTRTNQHQIEASLSFTF